MELVRKQALKNIQRNINHEEIIEATLSSHGTDSSKKKKEKKVMELIRKQALKIYTEQYLWNKSSMFKVLFHYTLLSY